MEITSTNYHIQSQGMSNRLAESRVPNQTETQTPQNHSVLPDGKVTLPAGAREAQEAEEALNNQFLRVYTGTYRGGAIHDPEKSARLDDILSRLSKNEQAALIDNNTKLFDDQFLQLAEELSNEELRQFVAISSALQTPPLVGGSENGRAYSGTKAVINLVNSLSGMDADTRTRVLDKAEGYAETVVKMPPSKPTYDAQDIWNHISAAGTANDLFNFNSVLSASGDINGVLDKLEQFDEPQQKQLLGLLRRDSELGDKMMNQLVGRDSEAQSAILDYVSELDLARKDSINYNPFNVTNVALDFDNTGKTVIVGMIEDTVSLLENYRFDDDQLKEMGEQLQQMGRSDQRAYLAISETGLETLLRSPANVNGQIDLSEHKEAFEQVDHLRNDLHVRDLVFKSRVGEESLEEGERVYELKTLGEAKHDVEEMVRFLTSDAWLSSRLGENSAHQAQTESLVSRLSDMGAEQRDQLIQDFNRLGQKEHPMAMLSDSALQDAYGDFFDRTISIATVDDVDSLMEAAVEIEPKLRESFWQATELAGEKIDGLLKVIGENGSEIRERIIVTLAEQTLLTESNKKTRDEVGQELSKLINYFEEDHTSDEKLNYLERAF